MPMSNRDQVGQGLALVADGLGPFVDARMTAAVPGGQDWVAVLGGPRPFALRRRAPVFDVRCPVPVARRDGGMAGVQGSAFPGGYGSCSSL
jgi:hypothetical protein